MATAATVRPTPTRRAADTSTVDRSLAIVEAATQLLREGGLDELTIRAVLKRTGLARRAFYDRFAGKDDLVIAVFASAMSVAAVMFEKLIAPIPQPIERLRVLLRTLGRGASTADNLAGDSNVRLAAALSREHIRLAEARPAELDAVLAPLLALIAREMAAGMADGSVRQSDPSRLALFAFNLIATTVHTELIGAESDAGSVDQRDRLADDLWEFCRRAIVA